jgi:hypothetical protein
MAKPKSYFEPWVVTQAKPLGGPPFPNGAPAGLDPEVLASLQEAWDRAVETADWIIWGSGMTEPAICHRLDGSHVVTSDRRIIAVSKSRGLPKGSPEHGDIAKRISACVNACAGIGNPEETIELIRALLRDLALGETDRGDGRVVSALARLIPPEEMKEIDPYE